MKPRPEVIIHTCLVIAFTCFTALTSVAQSEARFQHYTVKDGLASDNVRNIVQDSLGYIWISHPGAGLSRFDGYNFKTFHYDADDPARSALDFEAGYLTTDAAGAVWLLDNKSTRVSTRQIAKYDARTDRFTKYAIDLKNSGVKRFRFDNDNSKIWLGSNNGIYSYTLRDGKVENFVNGTGSDTEHDNSEIALQNIVSDIKDFGSYLLLATDYGLWRFDKVSKKFSRPLFSRVDSTFLSESGFIVFNSPSNWDSSSLWIRSGNSQIRMDMNFSIQERFDLPDSLNPQASDWDREAYWFQGSPGEKGLCRYDLKSRSITSFRHDPKVNHSLLSNTVSEVTVDREQNVWVCTPLGISRLKRPDLTSANISFTFPLTYSGVFKGRESEFLLIAEGKDLRANEFPRSNLIIAQLPGESGNLRFEPWINIEIPNVDAVYKGKKFLWVGARIMGFLGLPLDSDGSLKHSEQRNPELDPVLVLKPWQEEFHRPSGAHGLIRLGNRLFGKDKIPHYSATSDDPNALHQSDILAIWEDHDGDVWVGQSGLGLNRISSKVPYGKTGAVTKFLHDGQDTSSISSNAVYAIYPEDESSFWVLISEGVDLAKVDHESGQVNFEHVFIGERPSILGRGPDGNVFLGTTDGLYLAARNKGRYDFGKPILKEHISGAVVDDAGQFWLCTPRGLLRFDRKTLHTTLFASGDGIDHTRGKIHRTADGKLILVDQFGVSFVEPKSFRADSTAFVPVLTELRINNLEQVVSESASGKWGIQQTVDVMKELTLDYLHNNFSIEFSSMEMTSPEKNTYRHRLEGFDPDWIETDFRNRTAAYTNLPAGEYTFRVRASNHHGIWSNTERTLKVIILPPPWRTWWAYTGYGLFAVGILLLARRNLVQRERLAANLKLEHIELQKAQEVDRVKTSFFTNISHEFRTPLTLIKGPVQDMLEQFKDDHKVQQRLKLVQRNSDLLLKLINQLLDLAKLESGTLKVEKTEGEVNGFMRAVASSFESLARQKGVSLSVDVPTEPNFAMFDKDKVETILINLINNAIKFTPSGGSVTVSPQVGSGSLTTDHRSLLTLFVKDTGIGIPPEHQSRIFERFHQVSEAHKEVGTGIGLSLVKELVMLMGGEISVASETGKGSTFTVSIPVEPASSDKLQAASPGKQVEAEPTQIHIDRPTSIQQPATSINGIEDGSLSKPQVLVVEDNSDLRAFIIDSLGTEFHFHEAENGKQGLAIATEHIPDMIISDVMMPEMDGMEMTRRIKEDIKTSHIPLILLTAKSGEDSKLEGLSKGADDYLTKPFNKQELLLKVRNGTARMQKLRDKLKVEVLSSAPTVEVMSADEQFLNNVKDKIIERMSDEQLSVESLSDDMGMSRVQLYRKVSALTGMAVNELIRKLRLQRAAQLLQQEWGPVSQVAYEVGFSNLSYFSKVFKEEFGALPSEYEKKS